MFPTKEKYRINGKKNSCNTRYYYLDEKRVTAKDIAGIVQCDVNKARLFLNQYDMPPEKFVKMMKKGEG